MTIAALLEEVVQGPAEVPGLGTCLLLRPTQELGRPRRFPTQAVVVTAAARRVIELSKGGERIERLLVLGDVDPTNHPDFRAISRNLRELCTKWFPKAQLTLLANRPDFSSPQTCHALGHYHRVHLRLETGTQKIYGALTGEAPRAFKALIEGLEPVEHRGLVICARFVRGEIDNSTDNEVRAWLRHVARIKPVLVQISTLARAAGKIRPITKTRMGKIADLVADKTGIPVEVVADV